MSKTISFTRNGMTFLNVKDWKPVPIAEIVVGDIVDTEGCDTGWNGILKQSGIEIVKVPFSPCFRVSKVNHA